MRLALLPLVTLALVAAEPPAAKPAPAPQAAPGTQLPTSAPKPAPGQGLPRTAPKDLPPSQLPKADAPKAEAPKAEAPKAEAPKAEAPKAEAPKAEAPKAEAPKAHAHKPAAPKVPAKAEPKVDRVIGVIGTQKILESELQTFISLRFNDQQRAQLAMMPGAMDQVRAQFVELSVLAAKARQQGLDKEPDFAVKRRLIEMNILIQAYYKQVEPELNSKLETTEAQEKAYFDAHKEEFKTPESFQARHILVATNPQGAEKARTEEELKTRVAAVQEALKAGKKFEDVATEFSDDPGSKAQGGSLGSMPFGSAVPEFEAAVRAQELDKVGEPVKTQFGMHIIKVESRTPASIPAYDAVKEQVKRKVATARQEEVHAEFIAGLKKEVGFREATDADQPKADAKAGAKAPRAPKAGKAAKAEGKAK